MGLENSHWELYSTSCVRSDCATAYAWVSLTCRRIFCAGSPSEYPL